MGLDDGGYIACFEFLDVVLHSGFHQVSSMNKSTGELGFLMYTDRYTQEHSNGGRENHTPCKQYVHNCFHFSYFK